MAASISRGFNMGQPMISAAQTESDAMGMSAILGRACPPGRDSRFRWRWPYSCDVPSDQPGCHTDRPSCKVAVIREMAPPTSPLQFCFLWGLGTSVWDVCSDQPECHKRRSGARLQSIMIGSLCTGTPPSFLPFMLVLLKFYTLVSCTSVSPPRPLEGHAGRLGRF